MAEVKKGPYEILVRFNCEIGEKFGVVRGTQLATRSFLVDDAGVITSKVDSGRDDHPHDFPTEDLPGYLGDGFVAFDAQIDNMRAETTGLRDELDTANNDAAVAKQALGKAEQQIKNLTAERDAAKADATISSRELLVAQQLLAAASTKIDSMAEAAVTASAKAQNASAALSAHIEELQGQIKALNDEIDLSHSM